MTHRIPTNETFFDMIDSEEKAYLLGFFLADGCISKERQITRNSFRFQVNLAEKDLEIIEYFQKYVCPLSKISTTNYNKQVKNRQPVKSIRWTSTIMKNSLEQLYGISIRKTYNLDYTFPFDKIPNNLVNHFVRGYFDGDGHISFNEETKSFTFGIYGTQKHFLNQIKEIFEKEFNIIGIIEESKKSSLILYQLRFNSKMKRKEFIKSLHKWFYMNSTMFLKRKEAKFNAYLNTVLT